MTEKMSTQHRVQKIVTAIQTNRYVNAITGALMGLLPITIIGAVGSLLNGIPIEGYQNFLTNTMLAEGFNLKLLFTIPVELTTNLFAVYAAFMIAKMLVESYEYDGTTTGLLSIFAFLAVTPFTVGETGAMINLDTTWFSALGLFTAFITSIITAKVVVLFFKKGWTIKMPAGVPPTVSKSFANLLPGIAVMVIMLIIRGVFSLTPFEHLHQLTFGLIALPLQTLGGSIWTMVFALIISNVLWIFGIHGAMVVFSVFMPVWMPLDQANLVAFNQGAPIPNMVSMSLLMQGISMGGGQTLGLALAMLTAKSEQYRMLGKLAVVPNACGINEPIIFGTPIVMNFKLAIPFIVTPAICVLIAYFGMQLKLLPLLPGISAPLGTPIIISGFISSGWSWQWALYQALMIGLSYVMYKPFFAKVDNEAYAQELEAKANQDTTSTTQEAIA